MFGEGVPDEFSLSPDKANDEPNVNIAVKNLIDEHLQKLGCKKLLDIGMCFLHVVNNAFNYGVKGLPVDVSDFLIKSLYFVHNSDLRVEVLEKIQKDLDLPIHDLVKHSEIGWPTLGSAADRAIEQWTAIENLILIYIPKNDKETANKKNYFELRSYVKNPLTKPLLAFVGYLAKIFTKEFTLLMQKDQPLIHILYSQLTKFIYILLTHFMQPTAIPKRILDIDHEKLFKNAQAHLGLEEIKCGDVCSKILSPLEKENELLILNAAKTYYLAMTQRILIKLQDVPHLEYFECLNPDKMEDKRSPNHIKGIAKLFPMKLVEYGTLSVEWTLL
ncbi:hypothetical protein QAD02_001317 [Eretmocerus hayati]|uniref:Uncharacterized protein n=1 Tax=Eretmocerus hayati TaxID=131215 RepID=A0ACC2NFW1_9HYME|nr:hypothetical protein QAD02_001317 [Eretmocerus hayati]